MVSVDAKHHVYLLTENDMKRRRSKDTLLSKNEMPFYVSWPARLAFAALVSRRNQGLRYGTSFFFPFFLFLFFIFLFFYFKLTDNVKIRAVPFRIYEKEQVNEPTSQRPSEWNPMNRVPFWWSQCCVGMCLSLSPSLSPTLSLSVCLSPLSPSLFVSVWLVCLNWVLYTCMSMN